jgi:serine/threonine-protein kinase HipA
MDPQRVRLAMKIGSEYRVRDVGRRQWGELADALHLDGDATIARVAELVTQVRGSVTGVRDRLIADGLGRPIVPRLADLVMARSETCLRLLESRDHG